MSTPADGGEGRLILRNTAYLGIAEVLCMPLAVLMNALTGRYLGPAVLGHIYFAVTVCSAAQLVVGWGHSGPLPAAVALERSAAGRLLGTSVGWRLASSVVVYAIVSGACYLLGFTGIQQWAIGLVFLNAVVASLASACQDVIRGFERTDVAAYMRVGTQLLAALLVTPALVLGGGMRLMLAVQGLAAVVVLGLATRAFRSIGIGALGWDRALFGKLMRDGTPFVFFQLVLVLQPNIDAFYLAKLTTSEVVGWYAVAQRLTGVLLIPATALVGALYPTLCRLYASDRPAFLSTTRGSISTVSLVVVPVALCCGFYPDIGVALFGRDAFKPAEQVLRIFAVNMFLVYFSMPIGTALLAAGRQRIWTVVQLVCVANSALLDPVLIRHFQASAGNGGIALPAVATISELLMVGSGILLMPSGVFDRQLRKSLFLALLSGAAMAGAALLLRSIGSWFAAPIALLVYAGALYVTGAIRREQVDAARGWLLGKLRRTRASA